jgi:hypothetical protein
MLGILDDYLSDATTPEVKEAIRQAHELFDSYGLDTYEPGFEEILMTGDNVDTGETVNLIMQLTKSLQHQTLERQGVVISEDATITQLNLFLRGLRLMPDYDNPSALLGLLSMSTGPKEIVAEVMALVTGTSPDEFFMLVLNVDPNLLELMVENLDQISVDEDPETIVLKRNRVAQYKEFIEISGIEQLKVAYLLDHGMDVGHPFTVYLNVIGQDFEEMSPVEVANELVAMCVISSDANENPRAAISEHLEQYVSDINKITKIDLVVGELLLKLNHHEKA